MLRAAPPGHPLQKPTVVQWDIGAMLSADGAADESVSPQSGITSHSCRAILELSAPNDYAMQVSPDSPTRRAVSGVKKFPRIWDFCDLVSDDFPVINSTQFGGQRL
jgi:hypothetical protein